MVLRDLSVTGDLEVIHHKKQTVTFREGAVRIIALSFMANWKVTKRGEKDSCDVPGTQMELIL